jgi:plasmid stabilization system protein ParE
MTPVSWSSTARDDLARIHGFLHPRSEAFAARVERRLTSRAASLSRTPMQGRSLGGFNRVLSVPDIQYLIYYRLLAGRVVITSVHHTREDAR